MFPSLCLFYHRNLSRNNLFHEHPELVRSLGIHQLVLQLLDTYLGIDSAATTTSNDKQDAKRLKYWAKNVSLLRSFLRISMYSNLHKKVKIGSHDVFCYRNQSTQLSRCAVHSCVCLLVLTLIISEHCSRPSENC